MFGYFTLVKLGCSVKKHFFYFFTTQNLGAVEAVLLNKLSQELPDICQSLPKTTFPLYVYTTMSVLL